MAGSFICYPLRAGADAVQVRASDGIDFAGLTSRGAHFYFGAYDHAQSVTFGSSSSGTQTREAVPRPLSWQLVGYGADALTLHSDYVLDTQPFAADPTPASFAYPDSDVAGFLGAHAFSSAFSAAEKDRDTLLARPVSTSIYAADSGTNLDSQAASGLSWPLTKSDQQFSLAWARTLSSYPALAARLYFSADGQDAETTLGSTDRRVATLRSSPAAVAYWTRSAHLPAGLNPATNQALFVDTDGRIEVAPTNVVCGIRPLAALDPERILLAQEIVASPRDTLEVSADGLREYGTITTDGNYFTGEDAPNYKLTVISDESDITSLVQVDSGQELDASKTLYLRPGQARCLYANITGPADHLAYKLVRDGSGGREIVAYGISDSATLALTAIAADEVSPLSEGIYTAYVWAQTERSAASNEGSAPRSFKVIVDRQTPQTSIAPAPSGRWQNTRPVCILSAADNLSPIANLNFAINDDSSYEVAGATANFPLTDDGIYRITYAATDDAENRETTRTASYFIDTKPPVVTLPASGTYQPGTFALAAIDPTGQALGRNVSGVRALYYRINNEAGVHTYTGPVSLSTDGSYLISAWAEDNAGNISLAQASYINIAKQLPAQALVLSQSSATLLTGRSLTLTAALVPVRADKRLVWTSSNVAVASVSDGGIVRTHKAGRAVITATAALGGAKDTFVLTVENEVSSLAASHKTLRMTAGRTLTFVLLAYAKDNSKVTLNWKTTKYGAATIINTSRQGAYTSKGFITAAANRAAAFKIKANKPGKTTITITSRNGQRYSFKVTVVKKSKATAVKKLKITSLPTGRRLERNKSKRLKVNINPKAATNAVARWKSSRPRVITVDASGRVTALKSGKATITVTVGKKTAKVKLSAVKWSK